MIWVKECLRQYENEKKISLFKQAYQQMTFFSSLRHLIPNFDSEIFRYINLDNEFNC